MPSTLTRIGDIIARSDPSAITFPPNGIASGMTGKLGDLVYLSSGAVTQAAATSATIASSVEAAVLNQAVASGTATGTVVGIEKLTQEAEIELPIASSASTGSVGTPKAHGTTLKAIIGNQYGISRDSLGTYYIDVNVTSSALLIEITGISTRCPSSDTYPYMYGKIVPANRMA